MKRGRPYDIPAGGACAFGLSAEAWGAGEARRLLTETMTRLKLPRELVEDGRLAVSELATNALQHTGPPVAAPELWIWARTHPAPQLVISVFDTDRTCVPRPEPGDLLDEHGKGLGIVAELSAEWGTRPTRCRLSSRLVTGKGVWFALPLPEPWPGTCRIIPPAAAARRLAYALGARGIESTRHRDLGGDSTVTAADVIVHVESKFFSWKEHDGGEARYPLIDLQEVTERLLAQIETPRRPYP